MIEAPKYPRLVISAKTHIRLQKIAARKKKHISEITEKALSVGLQSLHW